MTSARDRSRGIDVPVEAHRVHDPIVSHGGASPTSISFVTADERWGRVTFESLDSIRVCRGEHHPYPSEREPSGPYRWVSVVEASTWLRERYAYEKTHYGQDYYFTGNVEEMLSDYSHYVFRFHDEYVEVLCDGIWFEVHDTCPRDAELSPDHPLARLQWVEGGETIDVDGTAYQVRRTRQPMARLLEGAELCSQKLLELVPVGAGSKRPFWTVSLRVREGRALSTLRDYFGNSITRYDGVADLGQVLPGMEKWLHEARKR